MNKVVQGITALVALGSGAFSVSFAVTGDGNSHNNNQVPQVEIYDEDVSPIESNSVRIQNTMVNETPNPEPTTEPTQEPEPSPLPTPPNQTVGGGNSTPPDTTGNDPRTPANPSPTQSRGSVRLP